MRYKYVRNKLQVHVLLAASSEFVKPGFAAVASEAPKFMKLVFCQRLFTVPKIP